MYFKYLQKNIHNEIKQEIRKGLNEKELSLIIVSVNNDRDIFWIKKGKEFRYKGAMYDIVKTKIKGRKKYYYCINDLKEKQLITSLLKNNRRNKTIVKLMKSLSHDYLPENYSLQAAVYSTDFCFTQSTQFYSTRIIDVASPPPRIPVFS